MKLIKQEEMKRGDVSKSIKCYMKESDVSEEEAREYMKSLIRKTWKEMNFERVRETPFSKPFIEMAINMGRMAQCMYENGDGHGHQDSITGERISALLFGLFTFQRLDIDLFLGGFTSLSICSFPIYSVIKGMNAECIYVYVCVCVCVSAYSCKDESMLNYLCYICGWIFPFVCICTNYSGGRST